MTHIALVIGSLSRPSIHRVFAEHITKQAPTGVEVQEVRIDDLPLYTQNLDAQSIPAYERVRTQQKTADAVLFACPEHNRSIPAAVKNLLDIASRPAGASVWEDKKAALFTASPGAFGGINAGLHLRQVLQAMRANVLVTPEVFLSRASGALNEAGGVSDQRVAEFLNQFAAKFYAWASAT